MKDWRLDGREKHLARWLKGKQLTYRQFVASPQSDHVHCEFCWEKIGAYEGVPHFGYCTLDGRQWVCEACFSDFKNLFEWTVVETAE